MAALYQGEKKCGGICSKSTANPVNALSVFSIELVLACLLLDDFSTFVKVTEHLRHRTPAQAIQLRVYKPNPMPRYVSIF
jgi:hypothetical protein